MEHTARNKRKKKKQEKPDSFEEIELQVKSGNEPSLAVNTSTIGNLGPLNHPLCYMDAYTCPCSFSLPLVSLWNAARLVWGLSHWEARLAVTEILQHRRGLLGSTMMLCRVPVGGFFHRTRIDRVLGGGWVHIRSHKIFPSELVSDARDRYANKMFQDVCTRICNM